MTPWIDTEKIRVGPISPEERRAIDAQLVRLLAQHRVVAGVKPRTGRPFVFGAVTQSKRKCNPEHVARLKAYNAGRSVAAAPARRLTMSRIKSRFAFSTPMRREKLPRSVWPRPDRAVSPQEKREASMLPAARGATGICPPGGFLDCGRTIRCVWPSSEARPSGTCGNARGRTGRDSGTDRGDLRAQSWAGSPPRLPRRQTHRPHRPADRSPGGDALRRVPTVCVRVAQARAAGRPKKSRQSCSHDPLTPNFDAENRHIVARFIPQFAAPRFSWDHLPGMSIIVRIEHSACRGPVFRMFFSLSYVSRRSGSP